MSESFDEICERLQSAERRSKTEALEELQRYCENPDTSSAVVLATFDECYLHLLKCYSDRFESVRDQAVQTVSKFIARLPPNDFHLTNVVATLAERMGQQETLEESEEIRLLYVSQLRALVRQYANTGNAAVLQECYEDIVRVLVKGLRDPYPAVQRESCACLVSLARAADSYHFQSWAEQLAKPVYGMLNHKHSVARIAAVEALARLALHINPGGEALGRLFMEVSPLLMDCMPLVRRECGQLGVLMLMELKDRYSYFDRVIPLVLCCLKDDSPEVVDYIRPLWEKCGKQYYEENEAELSKQELADVPAENYPIGVQRPTIGCRGLVQRSLRLLKLITRESGDWKDNVRLHSLKLLYQFVLHAEAAMTAMFFEIYPEMARACRDAESEVSSEALKVADLMGRLFSYEDWCEHGFDGLAKNARDGYLKCFYYMFTAAAGVGMKDVLRVSQLLINREFSQSLKPELQMYVLKMVETLLEKCAALKQQNDNEELDRNMYVASMKVMALSLGSDQANADKLQEKGQRILEQIAENQDSTVAALHEKFFATVLNDVENLDAPLDDLAEPIILLHGLVNIAKFRFPYMEQLQTQLNLVWQHCADEAKVKIFTAVSIAMLLWHQTIGKRKLEESAKLLQQFCVSVVEPHLMWHAGANAAAMRSLATATLCAMSQGAPEEASLVLPAFAHKYMPSLLEDHSTATRHYAVKCMLHFGQLNVDELKPIAYATLQRMDDPSAGIRELAATALSRLRPVFTHEQGTADDHEHDIWEMFIRKAFDMLFLHYEGPEIRLKAAIKGTILELAKLYPNICKDSYKRTVSMSYNCPNLKELECELPLSSSTNT